MGPPGGGGEPRDGRRRASWTPGFGKVISARGARTVGTDAVRDPGQPRGRGRGGGALGGRGLPPGPAQEAAPLRPRPRRAVLAAPPLSRRRLAPGSARPGVLERAAQLPQVPGPSAGSDGTAPGRSAPAAAAGPGRPSRPRPAPQAGALDQGPHAVLRLPGVAAPEGLPRPQCGCHARVALAPLGEATHRPRPPLQAGPPTLSPQPRPLRPSSAR